MTSALTSSTNNRAIEVSDVTVKYRSYKEQPTSLKESILRLLTKGQLRHFSTFDALSKVNFSVGKGEVLGIIGSNGSGKSTLLKVLSRVLHPSQGRIVIHGQVSSLIELGAGFDPELTAIENIYLNNSLYKRRKEETAKRVDAILDFAELRDFAHTPIKYYSSGMYARLGFSVAIDLNPDVLLIDEILGVGDERFLQKCDQFFKNFKAAGKTLVIVSHNAELLEREANSILLLSKGRVVYFGDPHEAVRMYRDTSYQTALHP